MPTMISKEYEAAVETHRLARATYRWWREQWKQGKCTKEEFDAALEAKLKADEDMQTAIAKELRRE